MDALEAGVSSCEHLQQLRNVFLFVNRVQLDIRQCRGVGYGELWQKYLLLGERLQQAQVQPKGRLAP
jgi:hypothetical protein